MRRLILTLALVLTFIAQAWALDMVSLFDSVLKDIEKIDLIITNIGYSKGSEALLDAFYREIHNRGISVNSLILLHSSYNSPLYFAFLNKGSGKLLYVEGEKRVVETVDYQSVINSKDVWNEKIASKVFGGREFAILSVSQLFYFSVPYDLHKSIEFHNHVCPGLLHGYLIAELLRSEFKPGERLLVFAVPPWCKDDALQTIFDVTVGKKGMYVRELREDEKKEYPDVAGIYVFWNEKEKKGRALILSFDRDVLQRNAGVTDKDYPWLWRLKQNNWIMRNFEEAKKLVKKLGEFDVNQELLDKLQRMDFNLREVLKR